MPRFSVNISLVLRDLPLHERSFVATRAGFRAIESWWPWATHEPNHSELDQFAGSVKDSGQSLVALNFFAGDMSAGDRGIVSDPNQVERFKESVEAAIQVASACGGCPTFNALYGNALPGTSKESQTEVAVENLSFAANRVAANGGIVVVEALNGFENPEYPLTRTSDVLQISDRVRDASGESIYVLYDVYHAQRMVGNLITTLLEQLQMIGHIQIADCPGRHEPGTGEVNFLNLFRAIDDSDYSGWVGLEYLATRDPLQSLAALELGGANGR